MILRRYGSTVHSVELNFDSKALNEIGFRRDGAFSIPTDEFESTYELVATHELTAEAEGMVQDETEQALLDRLEAAVRGLLDALDQDQVLVVENRSGRDYPKTKHTTKNLVVDGENRLHFTHRVEPPLRMGVYRRAG